MATSRPAITARNAISLIPNFMASRPPSAGPPASCFRPGPAVTRPHRRLLPALLGPDLPGVSPRGGGRAAARPALAHLDRGRPRVRVHRVHHLGVGVEHHLDLELADDLRLLTP